MNSKHPQCPIWKVIIQEGRMRYAKPYSPSLPDGEYDLYCEPPRRPMTDAELTAIIHVFDKRADACGDEPAEAMALMRDVCRAAIAQAFIVV